MKHGGAEICGSVTMPLEQLLMKNECDTWLESSGAFIIKRIVPVLDSKWLSHVRSCCKLLYKHTPYTHLFVEMSATTLLKPQQRLRIHSLADE